MSPLQQILQQYRDNSQSEREKGTYFEELIRTYFRYEANYAGLYSEVWMYTDWAKAHPEFNLSGKDTGIDLVAKTHGTDEFHAIQCKCFAPDYSVKKKDIDSFFTASGQKPFTYRLIVATTNKWSDNAEAALINQTVPVSKIDLHDLENSQIEWAKYQPNSAPVIKRKYGPRPHQTPAINDVTRGLQAADRGKLIMACGTGKTFTSLKIAEKQVGKGGRVLFLVPSLSLLSQSLTEWTQQSITPLHSFAVCSDAHVGKKRKADDDIVQTFTHELRFPATTKAKSLAKAVAKRHSKSHMSVVFSTYHSIAVINEAQKNHELPKFDLIICDEAHRTTGSTFTDEDDSNFVKVHDNDFIKARKRLYMTATPRIYGEAAKAKEAQGSVALYSMDDEAHYGKELHVITFSKAVTEGLLCDYKVVVLAVDESEINRRLQGLLDDGNNSLKVDDAAKIVGCWKALAKQGFSKDGETDLTPMQRAVAFCQVIEPKYKGSKHKVSSKQIASMFSEVVEAYQEADDQHGTLACDAEHVDGSMNASEKEAKINWLKEQPEEGSCKILSNVRCLSEGVDVPALDAVLFLTPRNSQVDVVQSVGRVMRNTPEGHLPKKKLGYVVLPVVIPAGMAPSDALNNNETYRVVWEVLQALRSHDDRFDADINRVELMNKPMPRMEVIAVTNEAKQKAKKPTKSDKTKSKARSGQTIGNKDNNDPAPEQVEIGFEVGSIEKALYAKLVKKCGKRLHWEDWANDIAKIARTHIDRITNIVTDESNSKEVAAFTSFADELRDDLNDAITNEEVIEMLAQHLITKPVFDALFEGYSFASNNPVSQAMQGVLDLLEERHLDKERDTLEQFYQSVKMRASGIDNAEGKQKIVVELYDKFFRNAFPRMTERLGIVYTPVEVVDFIIHSVDHLLQKEFGQTLGSEGVHIIDPFTGTGTFITRLLQSGLIKPEQLEHKYKNEIHANEIVLLAYYIAAINIEAVYHSLVKEQTVELGKRDSEMPYQPFEGICLTDTFQLHEKGDMIQDMLAENSARRIKQQEQPIKVIMGNPPYSAGQADANENNQNVIYPRLDQSIQRSYVAHSSATNQTGLYDSYIRAIRWASDQVGKNSEGGIIGFVTNAKFIDSSTADGLRKCLAEEFSSLYIFHLRGNARTSGEQRRKEKDNVFGQGTRTPIAISLLVTNPNASQHGQIYFHDVGDYLSQTRKLQKVSDFGSVEGIPAELWRAIQPDKHGDWINQRDGCFGRFLPIGAKDSNTKGIFNVYSAGVKTSRDWWCTNGSKKQLISNLNRSQAFFDTERNRKKSHGEGSEFTPNFDSGRISWNRGLLSQLSKSNDLTILPKNVVKCSYRPYTKQWLYFDNYWNDMIYRIPAMFPEERCKNVVIAINAVGAQKDFSSYLTACVPDLHILQTGQCFPLYLYEEVNDSRPGDDLFTSESEVINGYRRKDGISGPGLAHFQAAYPSESIGKKDLFYYIYGLLHSEDYRTRFAANLSKELPRIPAVKTAKDFWHFSKAGRDLAELHLNYETVAMYPGARVQGCDMKGKDKATFRVEKMKYGKERIEGKSVADKTTLHYNNQITVTGIPLEAYDYVVNGKPALDWVVERQCVKTDKKSGIVNDANDWANETMKNPRYPLELFLRVVTVSLETMKIVRGLPPLDID